MQKRVGMAEKEETDCFKLTRNEFWCHCQRKSMGSAKICHWRNTANVQEHEQIAKAEWEKIAAEKCKKVIDDFQKRFKEVILPNGLQPNIIYYCLYNFFFLKLQAEKYIWLNYFEPPIPKLYKFGYLLLIFENLAKLDECH